MLWKRPIGEFPYTYVRSNVMKSLLIKKEEYHRLLKMSLPEITRFLQESAYKKEIDELATKFKGIDLLELAISRNLANSFNKLKKISPPRLRLVLFIYLKRIDMENIKKILRGKFSHSDEDRVLASLVPAGILSREALLDLWKKDSIEAVLKNLKIVDFKHLEGALHKFKQDGLLVDIETVLDRLYYKEVMEFSNTLPVQGKFFREFLNLEMEIRDVLTIFMLKREKMDNSTIKTYLITPKSQMESKTVNHLIKINDFEGMISFLETSKYSKFLDEGIKRLREENTLLYLEKEIKIYLLKQTTTFTHKNPLSIQNIMDYMFGKENEANNLMKIIKGKQLGVDEHFIESIIVI